MLLKLGSCEKTGRPAATLTLDSTKARDKKTQEIKITIEEVEEEDSDGKHPKDEDADETNTGVTLCDTSFICFSEPIVMDDQSLLFTAFTTFKIEDKM
ncbi:Protein of unknown function [Pyronema omphalodes CBS 100304]|uniref:Uncharacterized protein n=1 Tax=Pyronema omphalodes (strain CBS 100304) TaxID=1076935 RepID=U4LN71_PYROM|nr:Protein of unknown function [Pyronema omphalodes CBS 100304]